MKKNIFRSFYSTLFIGPSTDTVTMQKIWDSEEIFFEGDLYFRRLIEDINRAKRSISIEVYIFAEDTLGHKIQEALIQARKRGVRVQIIIDGIGSHELSNNFLQKFYKIGIRVKVYNPLPFYHPLYGKLNFSKKFRILNKRALRINKRNHRKIFIIDERTLYTGSFNISATHTSDHYELAWQDTGVRVTGDRVEFATLNFKKNWKLRDYYRYKKYLRKKRVRFQWKHFPLRLNQNLLMRNYFYNDLISRIKNAESRIWLTTPYFIPKRRLIRLIARAAQRGVDVTILISDKSDVAIFQTLQYFYYGYLLKKGVKIYHYTNSILHAKNFIIDDWMTIGSSNLNHRSFLHDLEVDLIISEENNKWLISKHFEDSLSEENRITQNVLDHRPWYDKLLGRILFTFKYWF